MLYYLVGTTGNKTDYVNYVYDSSELQGAEYVLSLCVPDTPFGQGVFKEKA